MGKKRKTIQKLMRNDMIISLGYDMSAKWYIEDEAMGHQRLANDEASSSASRPVSEHSSRPVTAGGRIPSTLAKARLSRTSQQPDDSTDDDNDNGGDDSHDSINSDNVLITEIETPDEGQLEDMRARRRKKKIKPIEKQAQEEGAEWDTDLEIDDEWMEKFLGKKKKKKNEKQENVDPTGRSTYQKMCERLGVVPVSYFLRHIQDKQIIMRYHGLGPKGTRAIARVLRENSTLETLNLDGNWMEGEGGLHVAKMLTENDYIKSISLADNKLSSLGAYHISKMLLSNNGLRRLNLSGNELTDKEAPYLAEAIDQNKFLKELNLSHNSFGEAAGEVLGPAIGANDILEVLDLSWNQLRRKGAVAIAKGLKENVRLKKCNLAWNGLGQEGGSAIADAIAANDALKELDISGNRLEGSSAFLVAKGLRKNEDLTTLKLGNNPISTSGAVAIVTALHENESSAMALLDLKDIPVEYEFLRVKEELAKRNPEFRVCHGPVLRSGNTQEDIGKPGLDPYPKDPLIILKEHMVVNDFRIMDILQRLDTEETLCVTPEQFASALDELGVRYTKTQVEEITKNMDKNNDGTIYYGDMLKEVQAAREKIPKESSNLSEDPNNLTVSRKASFVNDEADEVLRGNSTRLSISRDGPPGHKPVKETLIKSKSDITEKITTAVEETVLSNSEIVIEN